MVDMAHYAGLVAAGVYPSPLPHAHVVTTTTHKTLRGPRGGMVLSTDAEHRQEDQLGGVPRPAGRAADAHHRRQGRRLRRGAAARLQDLRPATSSTMRGRSPSALTERGLKIVSGGTDSHVMLVDLRPKKATGVSAEKVLDRAGITVNKNSIPGDPEKHTVTSGVRLGSPAGTTRGFGVGRVPPGRPPDRRRARRHRQERPGRRRPGRDAGARQGARALYAAFRSTATDNAPSRE